MVDGAYFLKRYRSTFGREHTPEQTASNLFKMCLEHLDDRSDLYRIFFYDCAPLSKKAHNPISGRAIDFSRTEVFKFRTALHKELVKTRKLALRLGRLADKTGGWRISPSVTKDLLAKRKDIKDLVDTDVTYEVQQKGVDMKMSLDIASIAFKRLASRIVMVAGDADFVPAAKHARREGIDVILDPMWQNVGEDLFIHIDGLASKCPKPSKP